jgi:hypothetical protein
MNISIKKMSDLKPEYHGCLFTAYIRGSKQKYVGKISVMNGEYYLCQNRVDGKDCSNKLGYSYSYLCKAYELDQSNNVKELTVNSPIDPSTYKDWQVGDKIAFPNSGSRFEILSRNGSVVVYGNERSASSNYTCEQLFSQGWRLDIPKEEEPKILELTIDQIAEKYGMPATQIKIKK